VDWLKEYGLWTVLIGSLLEGDWVMLAAGGLAQKDLLPLIGSWLVGALGAYVGHLAFYFIGRYLRGKNFFTASPKWQPRIDRALSLIRTYPVLSIFFLQYVYGMRLAGAVALGFSEMPWFTFLTVQVLNCLIWSGVVLSIGYGATGAVTAWLKVPDQNPASIVGAVVLTVAFLYIFFKKLSFGRRKTRLPSA
jgi:membrane protein DedA with SNARE-associated domain